MARVARLFHFAANTLLLVVAIATGCFAYAAFMGTGPFVHTDLFPTTILIVLAVQSVLLLATSLIGCCAGYRQSTRFLLTYTLLLLLCAAVRITAGTLAHKASNPITASASVSQLWQSRTPSEKTQILSMFGCCGWTDSDALAVEVTLPDGGADGNTCSGACAGKVAQNRVSSMTAVAWVMWVLVVLECLGIVCASAMMLGIR
ncbi:hypothetical protein HK097_003856, partial [Rhizophlyctis rosea]